MLKISELRKHIQHHEAEINLFRAQIAEIHDECIEKASKHISMVCGIDPLGLVKYIKMKVGSFDNNTMRKILFQEIGAEYTIEQWNESVGRFIDVELIAMKKWFLAGDGEYPVGDFELDESWLKPEDDIYVDPFAGEEISKEDFFDKVFETYQVTQKYLDLVKPFFDEVE